MEISPLSTTIGIYLNEIHKSLFIISICIAFTCLLHTMQCIGSHALDALDHNASYLQIA